MLPHGLRIGRALLRGEASPRRVVDRGGRLEVAGDGPLWEAPRGLGRFVALDEVERWLPPVEPPLVVAVGRNYADHCAETGAERPPERPLLFLKAATAVIGDGQPIRLPPPCPDAVDYEAELGVVIGRAAARVRAADALDFVAGFVCANDVSARDAQAADGQWARAKSFDTFCPLGRWLSAGVDLAGARIESRVNGETRQRATLADMVFKVPELIEYITAGITLPPGTVIVTGTPAGVGGAMNPPRYLRAGDRVEVEIDGLGVLANPVAAADA